LIFVYIDKTADRDRMYFIPKFNCRNIH